MSLLKGLKILVFGTAALCVSAVNAGSDGGGGASGVTVYGKIHVSLNKDREDKSSKDGTTGAKTINDRNLDTWTLNSNASRIGVKGSTEVNHSLKAIYKMEYETYVDDGSGGSTEYTDSSGDTVDVEQTLKQRNIYGGLQGDFGTIIVGKFDTPLKYIAKKVDLYSDYHSTDIKKVMKGEYRASNVIQYSSPKMMDAVKFNVAVMPGEDDNGVNAETGVTDGVSASISYSADMFTVAVARNKNVNHRDNTRVTAQVTMDMLTVAALMQTSNYNYSTASGSREEQDAEALSIAAKVSDHGTVKVQVAMSETTDGSEDVTEYTQTTLGYGHKLSKKTEAYVYASQKDKDKKYKISRNTTSEEYFTGGIGFITKF